MEDFTFKYTFDAFKSPMRPITANSAWVQAFNIWRDDEFEEPAKAPARQKSLLHLENPQSAKTSEAHSPTVGGLSELRTRTSTSPSKRRAPPGP